MDFWNSGYFDEENNNHTENRLRVRDRNNLILLILKRILFYSTILHGSITIIFLFLFIPTLSLQQSIEFYLHFSLVILVVYGILLYMIYSLQKSYIRPTPKEPKETKEVIPKIKPETALELLQGKTFQVYWYIFTHQRAGIREIQKALNFSSSGTVAYQISKLLKAGVILKENLEGKYIINSEIKIGVLKLFIRYRNRLIPRVFLYLLIYILGFSVYLILIVITQDQILYSPLGLLLLFFLITGTIIFIFESYKVWKLNPTK